MAIVKPLIKGIVIGNLIDVAATIGFCFPLAMYAMLEIHAARIPQESLRSAFSALFHEGSRLYFGQLLIGLGCSVLGGYVAGRIAKCNELIAGILSSLLCVSLGLYTLASEGNSSAWYVALMLLVASPMSGALGGYLSRFQRAEKL
jgi:hypothetical protein